MVDEKIIVPLGGMDPTAESTGFELGEETINFYPDEEGYLVNYPGKVDYVKRPKPDGTSPEPPVVVQGYTRVHIYKDGSARTWIIFVLEDKLCAMVGNGYRILYQFKGRLIDGNAYPTIFTHKNLLIVLNAGDMPLMWDGWQEIAPLGVTEVPPPPITMVHEDALIRTELLGGVGGWLFNATVMAPWGNMWLWHPLEEPINGLSNYGDQEDLPGFYKFRVQYVDRYGNRGPISPPSQVVFVPVDEVFVTDDEEDVKVLNWVLCEWKNPHVDWHIGGVIIWRTLNLHPDLGNNPDTYYMDWFQFNTTQHRYTPRKHDFELAQGEVLIEGYIHAPTSDYGCSFAERIFIRDYYDQQRLWWGDVDKFGQFQITNFYTARDKIEALIPMGDRMLVITHSTTEVLYSDANGFIRLLEVHDNKGTYYGRSFSTFRNMAFGLFHDGFYIFDGESFNRITTPYWLEREYVERFQEINASLVRGDWYYLSCRLKYNYAINNVIMMHHLPTGRWFIVEDNVFDMALYNEKIIGVCSTVNFLYEGTTFPESSIHIRGMVPKGKPYNMEYSLTDLSLLVEPNSEAECVITISGDDEFDKKYGECSTYPSYSTVGQRQPYPYWNQPGLMWANEPSWVAPNDKWIQCSLDRVVSGFRHTLKFDFAAGGPQRIKAIGFNLGGGDRQDRR